MKARLGILALLCPLVGACVCAPRTVTEAPVLYEQFVVYGGYEDVLAAIDAKVEECMEPSPLRESELHPEAGTAGMYMLGNKETAQLVLKLQELEEDRTRIDVYAGDLSKMAWPRLRGSIQYGALGKSGCPDSPQPDVEQ